MGKAFRWISEGVLKDIVGGKVVVYMGRRIDAVGNLIEGEIVRNHTIDAAKLDQWVKDGRAEYLNIAENVVDKLAGKPSPEAAREQATHQQTADHTDAVLRMQALADLRRILDDVDDEVRQLAEMELAEVPTAELREYLDMAMRERDRRKAEARPDPARAAAEKRILDLYDDPVFSDKERARAAKGVKKIPDDKLAVAESDITAERDRRKAKAAQPDLGAGPAGGAK